MLNTPEIGIIITTFILGASGWLVRKEISKFFKHFMIFVVMLSCLLQYFQIENAKINFIEKQKSDEKLLGKVSEIQNAVMDSKKRPAIDLEREQLTNMGRVYIVNKSSEPAYNVQVLPLTDKLNEKNISILGYGKEKREFIGNLSFDDIFPLTQIRVRVYFLDSASNRYKWEFLITKSEVISILRQYYKKLPNGGNDYEHPVVEYKSGKYY